MIFDMGFWLSLAVFVAVVGLIGWATLALTRNR